jgi:Ca2+-binding EF-hand superfamily protein
MKPKNPDTNGDGVVSFVEFQESHKKGLSEQDIAKFNTMDVNSDGALSKEELDNSGIRSKAGLRPKTKGPAKMKPKNPDTNGDGVVSFVEFQESHKKGLSEQDIAKFNTMDVNSDGALSKEELDNSGIRSKEGLRPKRNNYQRKSQRRKRTQGRYTIGRQSRSNALRKEQ